MERLAKRAHDLGVEVRTEAPVNELPPPPVILALPLSAASRLLPDRELHAPGARVLLLDVAIRSAKRSPRGVFDLTDRLYLTRTSGPDHSLAPAGEDLIQTSAGMRPAESVGEATTRVESALDDAYPGWRERETWRRRSVAEGSTGAVDRPGTTWRDRPAIEQGDGIYLVGNAVAAPGLLSEVVYESAMRAAQLATG